MTLDVDAALAARFPRVRSTWDADRVILYHLALGAAAGGLDELALRLVWEQRLQPMATFAVVPGSDAAAAASAHPSIAADATRVIQGAHEVTVHRPLPVAAIASSEARIERVEDNGKAAVVTVGATTFDDRGEPLATNRFVLLVRGAGGFGGDAPARVASTEPRRSPIEIACPTMPQQSALYRLCGDRTPLHIDPHTARAAGFAAPPLPGLCTLGTVVRSIVEQRFGGEHARVTRAGARFVGPVYPGETLALRLWPTDDGVVFDASVPARAGAALGHGTIALS